MLSRMSFHAVLLAALTFLNIIHTALADTYITTTNADGETVYLEDSRRPSLYTGNFGDCLGSSAVNVTRFDAAYYKDNMTVLFHLAGNTAVANESLMMYIGVYAYGSARFDLTFNPCNANIASLCPMNASVPIEANGIIPVSTSDVANIPSIALSIPDFEGEAILRIFSNSTETEIACYSAVITNGNSFSQPVSVGTVLGVFAVIALLASFATSIYGDSIPVMRRHYAHSLSVFVVFAVFQHIFFTGVLSLNWPSVLVAWWSNFAWAGGMIYSSSMQSSINHLIGNNVGNSSQVGAAGSGTNQDSLGGGYDISLIYKRGLSALFRRDMIYDIYKRDHSISHMLKRDAVAKSLEHTLQRRALANSSTGYNWYGQPIGEGFPLPGNYSGFAGTLAEEDIRVSNAFMTGFLWFIILLVIVLAAVIAFKWAIECLIAIKVVRRDRLAFFREHWLGYTALVALRTCFIAFFMMMLLTMFQFSYDSSGGVKAIAAIVFLIFFVGIPGCVLYACLYRARTVSMASKSNGDAPAEENEERSALFAKLGLRRFHSSKTPVFFLTRRLSRMGDEPGSIHEDEDYVSKFGWLSARFRRTRWWFFAVWTLYEFIRACFYAGAAGHPLTQVFGLLVVEFLAFVGIIWARPFEGTRLNLLVVYLLGFSKVATVALSATFDVSFNLERITTTVIGIVIIVIQGVLTIVTMIAILVGAISSYMSVMRNRDDFRPRKWQGVREKYFKHIDRVANDLPRPPPVVDPEEPKEPYFSVASVRRVGKIEDEDAEFSAEIEPSKSYVALSQRSRTPGPDMDTSEDATPISRLRAGSRASMRSIGSYSNLPFGARPHRPSWSTRDFVEFNEGPGGLSVIRSEDPTQVTPTKASRTTARSATLPTSMLRPMVSTDSLRVGGNVSTSEIIGNVPSPVVRPRSGTFNGRNANSGRSTPGGRATPTHVFRDLDRSVTPTPPARHSYSDNTTTLDMPPRDYTRPLTPAAEIDELMRVASQQS